MPCRLPRRSPAALLAALLLTAVAVLIPARAARSAEFTDAAGRHVRLPDQIGRILPAERNAEVLVFVLAPEKLVGLERGPIGGAAARAGRRAVIEWRLRDGPATMAETAQRLGAELIV